jgi:dipeptidyl aminopeptidase/acylaminoacyl peptidase
LVDKPDVAIFQPQFSPDGKSLSYVSDESGWSNLYLYDLKTGIHRQLTHNAADVSVPAWAQGFRTYGFHPNGQRIYYVCSEGGFFRVWTVDPPTGHTQPLRSPLLEYTKLSQIAVAPQRGTLAFIASSSTTGARVISYHSGCDTTVRVWRRATDESTDEADLSVPQPVSWPAPDGTAVHGLYHPPASSRFSGTGLPPAIVNVHGGPTDFADAGYSARAQFFATRGYAYLEVNYRGSAGYGKPYMAALRGKWGVLDVEDAVGGAQHLVAAGLADANKLVIMGGSAGGYTVLKTLADHPGFFRAAICMYGISNLFTLAADTHKFEERYLDSMIGTLPQDSATYRERSPIFGADRIVDPVAIFQGEIDRVVPKAQSDEIVASLRRRGVPHVYHVYEGEGHGWRKRQTIEAFYATVEAFLNLYVNFA